MEYSMIVNKRVIQCTEGETILEVLRRNGIEIPTLCNLKEMFPTGACRLCMVELSNTGQLIPACSSLVKDNLSIETHSQIVTGVRKTIIEMLLARHPDDCLYCERNGNCELQTLAYELNIRERKHTTQKKPQSKDMSSQSIHRDPSKCILCGRCVRICRDKIGCNTLDFSGRGNKYIINTAFSKGLNSTNCISCGQCVISCPTAALIDKNNIPKIQKEISKKEKRITAIYSPLLPAALQYYTGKKFKNGSEIVNGILNSIGFSEVRNLGFGTDIYIQTLANECFEFSKKNEKFPLLFSFCPSFTFYVQQNLPFYIDFLSKTETPALLYSKLLRKTYSEQDINSSQAFIVSIEPCTARKTENTSPWISQSPIDTVLTFREFFHLFKTYGIQIDKILPSTFDGIDKIHSSASGLLSLHGGLTTAISRTLKLMFPKEITFPIKKYQGGKLHRDIVLNISGKPFRMIAINSITEAISFIRKIELGTEHADFIEVLVCPEGCINGGGHTTGIAQEQRTRTFTKMILDTDNLSVIQNPTNSNISGYNPDEIYSDSNYKKHFHKKEENEKN